MVDADTLTAESDPPRSSPVERPPSPPGPRRVRVAVALILLVGAVWSITGLDVTLERLLTAPGEAWKIIRQMFPPDLSAEYIQRVYPKVFESIYIAWIGTAIAATVSLPLSFLAAVNVAPVWLRGPVRALFSAIRAIPELIVAGVLLSVTGLGPWAGALAIGLHSIGTLGKLSTEAIESVDPGPREAIDAAGGRWLAGVRWGLIPDVLPTIVAYWLFRFEINVRASAVLGIIGAGGVGAELIAQLRFRQFDKVGTVLLITVAVVLIVDASSAWLRRRIITGSTRDASANREAMADLTGLQT